MMHKLSRSKWVFESRFVFSQFTRNFEQYSSLNQQPKVEPVQIGEASSINHFRCTKDNIAEHNVNDEALFYNISNPAFDRMVSKNFNVKGFPLKFLKLCSSFDENCMMIRKPGLELVNYLKNTNFKSAVNRFLLYGKTGCGKTMTMQYAVQHCIDQGWLVFPVYFAWDWIRYQHRFKEDKKQELIVSQYNKNRIDHVELCSRWLEAFRLMNNPLLDSVFTTKNYVWSKHESSEAGISFKSLVDHGIARPRNAADVIGCLIREIRLQDETTRPPVLVFVDGVNALCWKTGLKLKYGVSVKPDELSFVYNLKKLLSNSWTNGAVITAVNALNIQFYFRDIEQLKDIDDKHPYDMISREYFDLLDPHIPIEVPPFNDKEVLHMLAYFQERKWLGGQSLTKAGEDEIIQLSCYNPRELVQICGGLY